VAQLFQQLVTDATDDLFTWADKRVRYGGLNFSFLSRLLAYF